MVGAFSKASRPERVNHNASQYYNANEADRYTGTSNNIQKELTYKALELLGVKKGEFHFVADIGCGSGLSSRILSLEGYPWVGTDISLDMLTLAQTQAPKQDNNLNVPGSSRDIKNVSSSQVSLCQGRLTVSDMSQGLPFRAEAFDLAISISAVQWLCYNGTSPLQAARRYFNSVWRCLRTSESRAAFQVYLENDEHMNLLLEAATSSGFLATYCMDYPHSTTAKKFYIMLSKSQRTNKHVETEKDQEDNEETAMAIATTAIKQSFSRCCNLAWPATASCSLPWLAWREGNDPCAARACASRVVQEHANIGKRTLRLLRHASSCGGALPPPTLLSTSESCNLGGFDISSSKESVIVEIAVPHKGFMPCGGPFMLQLQAIQGNNLFKTGERLLESRKRKNRQEEKEEDGDEAVEDTGNDENKKEDADNDERTLSPAIAKLVQQLLGCSDAEMTEAFYTSDSKTRNNKTGQKGEKGKVESTGGSWPGHLQHARQLEHNTKSDRTSSGDSKKAFFYLEHVAGGDPVALNDCNRNNIAILHATKPPLPEILVLASDVDGGDGCKSLENARQQLVALCQNRNASVIGVDMLVHSLENVSCSWLVYVPGLQTTERAAVWDLWSSWLRQQQL